MQPLLRRGRKGDDGSLYFLSFDAKASLEISDCLHEAFFAERDERLARNQAAAAAAAAVLCYGGGEEMQNDDAIMIS